ncbi:hypothetical protein O1R50_18935 [Glycomyces luteolus]|uniref:Uncharacterized protein n=1 Tax=Glycomyces luteolus TaxID=2670330 RepID=A0A9X3PCM5_9ACTN|nr:hypothetical protein [Glycomyces luteolus]MDA1361711.1 hypothetical protein [Glycomyces luteolus]
MIEQTATPAPTARTADGSAAACAARAFGGDSASAGERLTYMRVFGGSADAAECAAETQVVGGRAAAARSRFGRGARP